MCSDKISVTCQIYKPLLIVKTIRLFVTVSAVSSSSLQLLEQSDRSAQQQPSFETFARLTGGLAADG